MRVEQLMTKQVETCQPDETLERAVQLMWEHDCGFVPVIESGGGRRVVGVVTDRDACMAAYTRGKSLPEIRAGEVMSTAIRACRPDDELAAAEESMREAQVYRLPVMDDSDRLLGVISLADIAREATREAATGRREVSPGEIGETLSRIRQPRQIAAASA